MSQIRDMLYVSDLEKHLGRSLTEDELDGNPFDLRLPNGNWVTYCVPLLVFPYDLITKPEDITEGDLRNAS